MLSSAIISPLILLLNSSPVSCRAGLCFLQQPVAGLDTEENSNLTKKQAAGFKLPMRGDPQQPAKCKVKWLHNPEAENALILNPGQDSLVPVVVDPYICRYGNLLPRFIFQK